MSTITTLSGIQFDPINPNPRHINISDISAGLSKICRFNGQIRTFYSVAEHSVRVSWIVPPEYAMAGLLHDASEAYLNDVTSPVKKLAVMAPYREIEERLQNAIYHAFGLPPGVPEIVHGADKAMRDVEEAQLRNRVYSPWKGPLRLAYWEHEEARSKFLNRFAELRAWAA